MPLGRFFETAFSARSTAATRARSAQLARERPSASANSVIRLDSSGVSLMFTWTDLFRSWSAMQGDKLREVARGVKGLDVPRGLPLRYRNG